MDSHTVAPGDEREEGGRPRRERIPPRYLQDYHTEFYGKPPKQLRECAEPFPETSETDLLRQEVAQLKGMVKELIGRVEQYEQSYSEGESEEECDIQSQEAPQAQYECNQLLIDTEVQAEKAQSEPNLSGYIPALNPGKISQSVQTLASYKPSSFVECEHKRPASAPYIRHGPELRHQEPSSSLSVTSSAHVPPNPALAPIYLQVLPYQFQGPAPIYLQAPFCHLPSLLPTCLQFSLLYLYRIPKFLSICHQPLPPMHPLTKCTPD